jgi:RimJ/RimL family protein N-acetyltransferase
MHVLDTERLTLRRLSVDDAPFMLDLLNEPSFLRFIGDRGVRTLDDARRYLMTGPLASYDQFGFGLYLVSITATQAPIGMCGLLKRPTLNDVDLGFAMRPAHWGQGYAFEAARAVMDHETHVHGLSRIVAITNPDNHSSIRVLTKLGMTFERLVQLSPEGSELKLFATTKPVPPP